MEIKNRFLYDADAPVSGLTTFSDFEQSFKEPEAPADAVVTTTETTPPATEEPVAAEVPTPVIPEVVAPVKDWRETVSDDDLITQVKSKFDRMALLKAAGIDEETIKAIEYKERTGGWDDYLKIKNTDYKAVAPEKLVELDLREKYKNLDNKRFEIVLKNELKKYNLDRDEVDENSEEAILGNIMLEQDAEAIRSKYIEKQQSLTAPAKQVEAAQQPNVMQQQITDTIRNSATVKTLSASRMISFGEGDEAINYEIQDSTQLIDTAISAATQNGVVPTEAQIKDMVEGLALFANKNQILKTILNHGKILGEKSVRKEAANVKPNSETAGAAQEKLSDAGALARNGVMKRYGDLFH